MRSIAAALGMLFGLLGNGAIAQDSTGTGFFFDRGGRVLTNAHVVQGCVSLIVDQYGPATVLASDPILDLAVATIGRAQDVKPLALRPGQPRLAETVLAIGFPLADVLSESVKVTTGNVNSTSGIKGDDTTFQMSAPIQPGNSGGPVIDESGAVVGISNATLAEAVYDRAQNVNFAIKSEVAIRYLSRLDYDFTIRAPSDEVTTVEEVASSVVKIECFGAQASQNQRDPLAPNSEIVLFQGVDFVGFDYEILRNVSARTCQTACQGSSICKAFTYNRRHGVCFLKDDVAISISNDDALGGIEAGLVNSVIMSGFMVQSNVDSVGGDYARVAGSSFLGCFLECASDARCRAFAYVTEKEDCWLKDRVGQISRQPGVEFGIR